MKRLLLVVILSLGGVGLVNGQCSFALNWYKVTDTVRYPNIVNEVSSTRSDDQYMVVACFYRKKGDTALYSGYKQVYQRNGRHIDSTNSNHSTVGMFFDKHRQRIDGVDRYAIKIWADQ